MLQSTTLFFSSFETESSIRNWFVSQVQGRVGTCVTLYRVRSGTRHLTHPRCRMCYAHTSIWSRAQLSRPWWLETSLFWPLLHAHEGCKALQDYLSTPREDQSKVNQTGGNWARNRGNRSNQSRNRGNRSNRSEWNTPLGSKIWIWIQKMKKSPKNLKFTLRCV
jgi:hypothetical protein